MLMMNKAAAKRYRPNTPAKTSLSVVNAMVIAEEAHPKLKNKLTILTLRNLLEVC